MFWDYLVLVNYWHTGYCQVNTIILIFLIRVWYHVHRSHDSSKFTGVFLRYIYFLQILPLLTGSLHIASETKNVVTHVGLFILHPSSDGWWWSSAVWARGRTTSIFLFGDLFFWAKKCGKAKLQMIHIFSGTNYIGFIYRWWFQYIFLCSPRKIGEDEAILTNIFYKWVGSTTN